jgi:TPR repeat protein
LNTGINQPRLALEHLNKAEQLYAKSASPLIADAQRALGLTYFKLKEFENAKHYLKLIYDHWRNDPLINYTLGLCYIFGKSDLKEAKKYLIRSQELGVKIPEELMQKLNL